MKGKFGTILLAITLAAGSAVVPSSLSGTTPAKTPKVKRVRFAVRNDSDGPLELMAGTNDIKLQPEAAITLTMEAGELITAVNATKNYKVGELLVRVGKELDGTTVVLH